MKNYLKSLAVVITSLSLMFGLSMLPVSARVPDQTPAPTTSSSSPSSTSSTSTSTTSTDSNCNATTAKEALQCGVGVGNNADPTKGINHTFSTIINIFSVVAGILAVIMVVLAGMRYITSGGAQDKVASAKNTLTYAVIGLIVVALAQVIVKLVLNKTINTGP